MTTTRPARIIASAIAAALIGFFAQPAAAETETGCCFEEKCVGAGGSTQICTNCIAPGRNGFCPADSLTAECTVGSNLDDCVVPSVRKRPGSLATPKSSKPKSASGSLKLQ